MDVTYTEEKRFSVEDIEQLFLSVGWVSGTYPRRLHRALMGSSTVITAWDGNELVGIMRAIDDGAILACIHYVIVRPDHQGKGIAGTMLRMLKAKYRDYLYIEVSPEEKANCAFYEKFGFQRLGDGVPLVLVNPDFRDDLP